MKRFSPTRALLYALVGFALWLLFLNGFSASYLIEGSRNWLGLHFASKESYVAAVTALQLVRFVGTGIMAGGIAYLALASWQSRQSL